MRTPAYLSSSAPTTPFPTVGRGHRRSPVLAVTARVLSTAVAVVAALLVSAVVGLGFYAQGHEQRIYEGVSVAGIPVGGLTEAAAAARVRDEFQAYAGQPLTLAADGQTFSVVPADVGADIDAAASAREAFAFGRTGSLWGRSQAWVRGLVHGSDVTGRVTLDAGALGEHLRGIAPAVVRAPVDAALRVDEDGAATVDPDVPGVGLDVAGTRARLVARLATLGRDPVMLATMTVPASVTAEALTPGLPGVAAAVDAPLALASDEGSWTVSPADLRRIVSVSPRDGALVVDRGPLEGVVEAIAGQIDHPATDAGITVDEAGALVVVPGTDLAEVDIASTVDRAVAALLAGDDTIELEVRRAPPAITDAAAAAGVAEAEGYLEGGLELVWDGMAVSGEDAKRRWEGGTAELGRDDLLRALVIVPRPEEDDPFLFDFDVALLAESLGVIADEIDDPAQNATFRLVKGRVSMVEKSAPGRSVDREKSLDAILRGAYGGEEQVALVVVEEKPAYTVEDGEDIELPDVLGDSSTSYSQSSEPRRKNVERAVELEAGWLVPPGEDFSYVEHVGKADESMGFVTGFGIVADEGGGVTTAPVVGGGICQVSTTIFQAAFWAGLPFPERYAHPYWLTGYGQAPRGMQGLDAMVAIEEDWTLDLKFTNTTEDWIAVELTADGENVVARIRGTDPKWEIDVDEPVITNVIPIDPKMNYADSPELPRGEELVVETAQEGFDATIHRTVKDRSGEMVLEDDLTSSYAPARNLTLRGTG
jgi:vancomycin resistance protein YoaR